MADYPNSIFSFRDIENRAGRVYDVNDKTFLYAEDIEALVAEIVAIQNLLGIQVNNNLLNFDPLFINRTTGKVGIGTSTPGHIFEVVEEGVQGLMAFDTYRTGTAGSMFMGRGAQGTISSPSAVGNNRQLCVLSGRGYVNGAFSGLNSGSVEIRTDEAWSTGQQGTRIDFFVTENGTSTPVKIGTINNKGNLLLGGTLTPTNGKKCVVVFNDTAPTAGVSNGFALYSKDVAGVAKPHVMLEDNTEFEVGEATDGIAPEFIDQNSVQFINNTTTLVEANDLKFDLGANEIVDFEMFVMCKAPNTADLKFGFNYPSGASIDWGQINGISEWLPQSGVMTVNTSGNDQILSLRGKAYGGGTAGEVVLTFAQNTAVDDEFNTYIAGGSDMKIYRRP